MASLRKALAWMDIKDTVVSGVISAEINSVTGSALTLSGSVLTLSGSLDILTGSVDTISGSVDVLKSGYVNTVRLSYSSSGTGSFRVGGMVVDLPGISGSSVDQRVADNTAIATALSGTTWGGGSWQFSAFAAALTITPPGPLHKTMFGVSGTHITISFTDYVWP